MPDCIAYREPAVSLPNKAAEDLRERPRAWRAPAWLVPFRRLLRLPEGPQAEQLWQERGAETELDRLTVLMNTTGSLEPGSFLARERTRVYVQVRLLYRLYEAGALVDPATGRPVRPQQQGSTP